MRSNRSKVTWLIMLRRWAVSVAATSTKASKLFIDAYNQHDIEKMLEKTSKDALRTAMITHFNQQTYARSRIKKP
jgi:hypothetical protein